MRHTIDYYVSKLEAFLNNNFPNIFENSLLNNVNIKLLLMIYLFLILSLIIVVLISTWKIFKKNNIPGYYALIPGYNLWELFKISGLKGYLSLIIVASFISMIVLVNNLLLGYALIPLLIIIGMCILLFIKMSITYNKNISYSFGLLFLPLIFFPLLAFDNRIDNQYIEIVTLN